MRLKCLDHCADRKLHAQELLESEVDQRNNHYHGNACIERWNLQIKQHNRHKNHRGNIKSEKMNTDKIQNGRAQAHKKLFWLKVFKNFIHAALHAVFPCRHNHLNEIKRRQPEQQNNGETRICLARGFQLCHMVVEKAADKIHKHHYADVCLFHFQGELTPFS